MMSTIMSDSRIFIISILAILTGLSLLGLFVGLIVTRNSIGSSDSSRKAINIFGICAILCIIGMVLIAAISS